MAFREEERQLREEVVDLVHKWVKEMLESWFMESYEELWHEIEANVSSWIAPNEAVLRRALKEIKVDIEHYLETGELNK